MASGSAYSLKIVQLHLMGWVVVFLREHMRNVIPSTLPKNGGERFTFEV